MSLVVLGEHHPQAVVDQAEHNGVGQHLRRLARTRRQSKEDTRGQQDKQKNRDDEAISYPINSTLLQ